MFIFSVMRKLEWLLIGVCTAELGRALFRLLLVGIEFFFIKGSNKEDLFTEFS